MTIGRPWYVHLLKLISINTVQDNQGDNQGHRGMIRFEADKDCFPDGLRSAMYKIKHQNPSISRVAVWHTMVRDPMDVINLIL
jgi:hypothetical protein